MLKHIDFLKSYVTETQKEWQVIIPEEPSHRSPNELYKCLGKSLIKYLYSLQRKRSVGYVDSQQILIKTPSIENLDDCFRFFTDAPVLILVRDGRAVVESHIRSFSMDPNNTGWYGVKRETCTRRWVKAAQEIIRFKNNQQSNNANYLLIKYEDLHINTEKEMTRILDFLDLHIADYNFQSALNIPVKGSSTFGQVEGKPISWHSVAKTTDFDPLNRASGWTQEETDSFNRIAGEYQEYFGYSP